MITKCPFCGHNVRQQHDRLVCSRSKYHFALVVDGVFRDTSPFIKQPTAAVVPPFIRK